MKKVGGLLLAFVFLFCLSALPVLAADTEVEQLKGEVQKLLKRIEEIEKKQAETQTKSVETEKKVAEVEKRAEKVEKKALKDRIEFGGEARFRIMHDNASVDRNFYGIGQPNGDLKSEMRHLFR